MNRYHKDSSAEKGYVMREFNFSETFIWEMLRRGLALVLFLLFFIPAFALYISNFRIKEILLPAGITILVFGIIWTIEILLINRRLRKLKVLIYDDKLVKQCGKKQQVLTWEDIARIVTIKDNKGVTVYIRLYPKKRKVVYLRGFRQMEELASLIKGKSPSEVLLREKHWRFNWKNPFVGIIAGGVPAVIIMFIIASMGNKAMDVFAILFALCVGLLVLMFRPLTKWDVCNRCVEIILGAVLLFLGFYGLICFLLSGKLP